MQTETLVISRIIIGRGAPPLDEATVVALVESMSKVGLLNPVTVWRPSTVMPELIAGHHRLEAAKRLGWETIDAYVMEGNDRDPAAVIAAEIAGIDENLIRRDLSDAERAMLVARRKELYEAQHPETAAQVAGAVGLNRQLGRGRQIGDGENVVRFTAATARATGRSERAVQRDATRGEALGADAARVVGTSLDSGVELDALARMPQEQRAPLIARAAAGETVSARAIAASQRQRQPRAEPSQSPRLRKMLALWDRHMLALWAEATPEERRAFKAAIDD